MIVRVAFALALALTLAACSQRAPKSKSVTKQPGGVLPPAMYRQVLNAVDAGDGDVRIRKLREHVAANPGDLQARLALADLYSEAGYPELAVEHSRLAAERFPSAPEPYITLARNLRQMGLAREGVRTLERHLAAGRPATPELYSWLGILRDDIQESAAAEQAHRKAVEMAPNRDTFHNNLGYNLLLQGKQEAAVAEFRRALALNPQSDAARNNLGLALADNPSEALLAWKSGNDPATAHNNLAAVLIEKGRYSEARKEIETALGYKRDHPAALKNLKLLADSGVTVTVPAKTQAPRTGFWARFGRLVGDALLGPSTRAAGEAGGQRASR
mgnify:CR=1 FL=1